MQAERTRTPRLRSRAQLAQERAKLAAMPPFCNVTGPSTQQAIRGDLRVALSSAIAQQLITFNPAARVELASGRRPKLLLGTDQLVRRWRQTGEIPGSSMIWAPQQFGVFFDAAQDDRLYALFHLVGFHGLRRGEAVGQDCSNVDLTAGLITPAKEIVVYRWGLYAAEPKTDGSANPSRSAPPRLALRSHKKRQKKERKQWGSAWTDPGKVFIRENGSWLHPETVSHAFRHIHATTDLPRSPSATSATSPRPSRTQAAETSTRCRKRCATPRSP
ncbi:hypothetical protein [Streptomyces sp. CA2R106]|uniref:hypothetical protein n=1 Tax=Streptomyces sp. CA2R106 TaxID=3120153 RepID=UPI00300BBFB0